MSQTSPQIHSPRPGSPPTGSTASDPPPPSSLETASAASLAPPPFRSTTAFPRRPNADQLPALYVECLQALKEANAARQFHRGRLDAQKQVIAAVRFEIARLEQDLVLEAGTRASLHAMNLRLVEALREMDGLVGDLDQVVDEAHRVPRSRLGQLIDRLRALIQQWRAFKRRQQQQLAGLDVSQQDGGRP